MSNQKRNAEGDHANPIDEVLNQDQDGKLSRPESIQGVGFGEKADDVAHRPDNTSQEHSLDDTQEVITPSCLDEDLFGQAIEDEMKRNQKP